MIVRLIGRAGIRGRLGLKRNGKWQIVAAQDLIAPAEGPK
jgi:hypothetical protein